MDQEELNVQKKIERKRKLQEDKEKEASGEPSMVSATSKQQWKEQLGLEARKRWHEEEELEQADVDDEEGDPDYQPEDDPKQEFIVEDAQLDEDETFKIEKHVHAINLQEAGDYVIEIRRFVSCFRESSKKSEG